MSNEGLEKDKTQEELKIDELNLAEASTYVHLFTRTCTILGYSVMLCFVSAVVLKVVSLVNFTDQFYSNGLPKVNLYKTSFCILFLSVFFWFAIICFNTNLFFAVSKGLKKKVPSFALHYIKILIMLSLVLSSIFLLFTFAMTKGVPQAICEISQMFLAVFVLIFFIVLNHSSIEKKVKPFTSSSDNVFVEKKATIVKAKVSALGQFLNVFQALLKVFGVLIFCVLYVAIGIVLYRLSGSEMKLVLSLFVHTLIVEFILTIIKFGYGENNLKDKDHPFYDHLMTFSPECIFNLFRRFMFNDTDDVKITVLLVVLSGFQEVLIRSTMEWKEVTIRRIMGSPPMSDETKILKRKYYSYTVTARSILELACILISPMMFAFFFNNRYAIDLGYNSILSLDYESMISSTVLQLCIELMVIYCCSLIEVKNGIPLSDFFYHFRDFRVFGSHLTAFVSACFWILYNFKTVPNSLICSNSNNPCSCPSFSVFDQLCRNLTTLNSTVTVNIESSNLADAFSTKTNITIVILSLLGLICIVIVTYYFVSKRNNEKYRVQVQQIFKKTILDTATQKLMEQSTLNQAISTIESLCRGVSPSQARLLYSVIEILKSQAKGSNSIDIERLILDEKNEGTDWLKEQLMSEEQKTINMKRSTFRLGATSHVYKPVNLRRLSIQLNPNIVSEFDLTENEGISNNLKISECESIPSLSYDDNNEVSLMMKGSSNDENLDVSSWEFNVFAVECKNPQSWLACKCFLKMGILEEFKIPKIQLSNILLFVEQNYSLVDYDSYSAYGDSINRDNLMESLPFHNDLKDDGSDESKGNQYHNNLHGADVFQGVLYFSTKYEDVGRSFTLFDFFSVLFAAYIHDFNHPGLNTTYMNSDWPSSGISSTFGSDSPLERHHLAMAFNLMRNVDQYNFMINFSPNKIDDFRKIVTECVMVTDLAKSMPWISSAKIAFKDWKSEFSNPLQTPSQDPNRKDTKQKEDHNLLLMQLVIKCADVGHPCRALNQHLLWSKRIRDEFCSQGDKERERGRKISPLCDRNAPNTNYPQGQIGFINYVSKPCFMLLNEICWSVETEDEKPWLKNMNSNIQYWEDRKKEVQIV